MAVKLRLRRMGKKRQPIYKVVAADARSPRDGRFIEAIGSYNPKTDPAEVNIIEERALYWLGVGAQPTTTVKNLLSQAGILLKNNLAKKGLNEEQITVELEKWQKLQEAKQAAQLKQKEKADKKKAATKKENTENESGPEVEGTTSDEPKAEEEKSE